MLIHREGNGFYLLCYKKVKAMMLVTTII
jgi:hypothetical protein